MLLNDDEERLLGCWDSVKCSDLCLELTLLPRDEKELAAELKPDKCRRDVGLGEQLTDPADLSKHFSKHIIVAINGFQYPRKYWPMSGMGRGVVG